MSGKKCSLVPEFLLVMIKFSFCVGSTLNVVTLRTRIKDEGILIGLFKGPSTGTRSTSGVVVHIWSWSTWRSHSSKEILRIKSGKGSK